MLREVHLMCLLVSGCLALTGHVCTRQKAEEQLLSYTRAFICPERYTTSCGHMDWRRCTKYRWSTLYGEFSIIHYQQCRVHTCYTPAERYITRYHEIDECCPGWKDAGAGSCTIPVCSVDCQNGGSCVDLSGMPGCKCQDGYHGDRCQHGRDGNDISTSVTIFLVLFAVVVTISLTFCLVCYLRSGKKVLPWKDEMPVRSPKKSESVNIDDSVQTRRHKRSRNYPELKTNRHAQTNTWTTQLPHGECRPLPNAPIIED